MDILTLYCSDKDARLADKIEVEQRSAGGLWLEIFDCEQACIIALDNHKLSKLRDFITAHLGDAGLIAPKPPSYSFWLGAQ